MTRPDWEAWLTEERMIRLNHLRERAGQIPLTFEDALRMVLTFDAEETEAIQELIG